MTTPLKIAVVGAGISGLGAAWLLAARHHVTLYEREPRLGGHSNTVDVDTPDGRRAVDTGFIVYNTASYPNLIALFEHLGVETAPASMSFAVSRRGGAYEYSGGSLAGLFGQPGNLVRPRHLRLIADTLRFFREAPALLDEPSDAGAPLGAYLVEHRYSQAFIDDHIAPMAAAIWSTPTRAVLEFPAQAFVRFFANHGLLQVAGRPQWRTVTGGSRAYVERLRAALAGVIRTDAPVTRITRASDGVTVQDAGGGHRRYDHCVVATHADDALALLGDPTPEEQRLLGAFRYAANRAVLHTDPQLMPRRRRLWSSWNYIGREHQGSDELCVTYWMNALQPLRTGQDFFVTLNPARAIASHHVRAAFDYQHPVFDARALAAQQDLWGLQGHRRTWFCGSYFGYGFHEDGLQAGLAVAEDLGGVLRPWRVAGEQGRIVRRPVLAPLTEAAE